MLAVVRAFEKAGVQTNGTVYFVGDVGEEGPGNLRGMRAYLSRELKGKVDYFISVDGAGLGIVSRAVGSNRYRVTYKGPGGHSYGAFGIPNPIHALGRAIAGISDIQVPANPKTTFNVGVIQGGTSVNSIAVRSVDGDRHALGGREVARDRRRESATHLARRARRRECALDQSARGGASAKLTMVDRHDRHSPDRRAVRRRADRADGARAPRRRSASPRRRQASSTDANMPISLGIPAISIDGGGSGGGAHSLAEWYDDGPNGWISARSGRRCSSRRSLECVPDMSSLGDRDDRSCVARYRDAGAAQQPSATTYHQLGHAILRELIETNTTASSGNTTVVADQLGVRFSDARFADADVQVVGPTPRNRNLVVRYRGTSGARKPVLLLAHLDVVEAKRDDWTYDPFKLTETDGYFYGTRHAGPKGRGGELCTALLRLKQEGWIPDRDLILALTAGEEGGAVQRRRVAAAKNKRALIDAEYVINVDAGGGEIENASTRCSTCKPPRRSITRFAHGENPGGHSSLPRTPTMRSMRLAAALGRVGAYEFPPKPNDVVKAYFGNAATTVAPRSPPTCEQWPRDCDAGRDRSAQHDAALQRAAAHDVRCDAAARRPRAERTATDGERNGELPHAPRRRSCRCRARRSSRDRGPTSNVAPIDTAVPSPASPLRPDLFTAIDASVKAMWGSCFPCARSWRPARPTDSLLRQRGRSRLRLQRALHCDDDVRAHGKDERIRFSAFDDGLISRHDFLKRIAR